MSSGSERSAFPEFIEPDRLGIGWCVDVERRVFQVLVGFDLRQAYGEVHHQRSLIGQEPHGLRETSAPRQIFNLPARSASAAERPHSACRGLQKNRDTTGEIDRRPSV